MALSDIDRNLLQRCLGHKPRAWEDFVDRYFGLFNHVINHSAQSRSLRLSPQDREDLASQVFLTVLHDEMAVLRQFRGESSLWTYLTVIARRVVVAELLKKHTPSSLGGAEQVLADEGDEVQRVSDRDEVERLLTELDDSEALIVRMFHLEGKSYQEISSAVGIAENSVGPTLSRARTKMRRSAETAE